MMRIVFVGDVFLGQQHWTYQRGISNQIEKGANTLSEEIVDRLSDADYFIGNLETPVLLKKPDNPLDFCYATSRDILEKFLTEIPTPIFSIANNHILDHGIEGYQQTLDILHDMDVVVIGTKTLLPDDPFLAIEHPTGTSMAIGAFCDFDKTGLKKNNLIWEYDQDLITEAIKRVKKKTQIVTVYLHWGREYVRRPSADQVQAMKSFVEAGADLIVGHHPHVYHNVYSDGKTVFASSLGNFIFDQYQGRKTREGIILLVDFDKENRSISTLSTYIPRKLPLKLKDTKEVVVTNLRNIRMYQENTHRFAAYVMRQAHRILSRIDLMLHIFPNTLQKVKCMIYWSSR